MFWIAIFAILAYFIYKSVIKPMSYWKERNIIYSKPWPILGSMSAFLTRTKSLMELFKDLYNEFPDRRYNGIFGFRQPQLLLRDPELIKQITIKDFDYFMDRTNQISEQVDPIFSKILVALSGQKWRDMRAVLSPSFTSNKMKFMFQLISECAEKFTEYFEKQSDKVVSVEMKEMFTRFTNDAIATTAFGVTVDSLNEKNNEFYLMGQEFSNVGGARALRFVGYSVFPALMRLLRISMFPSSFTDFFRCIIKETIEVREKHGTVRPDMIHLLLQTRAGKSLKEDDHNVDEIGFAVVDEPSTVKAEIQSRKTPLTDDEITAQALLFFSAGFETTATLSCFMSYELAVNPDIQEILQKEIDEALDKCNGKITYDVLLGMKYMDMVVSETLRKWPPGIALERRCVNNYTLQPVLPDEEPLVIEKGISVLISIVGIHHDPKYFPDPDKFNPERFSEENKPNIVPGSYLPFGAGPRSCIASRFALMKAKILFFHILAKFDIVTTEKTPIPLVLSRKKFVLVPDEGFWLGLKQRKTDS
ncbi:hypothetical protein ILUMI_18929 [Ignelater luminosus]|uniref:Cytochrome P450 n=1 Tax=Ignelater luminosus TaxID=2038154 RepID=A0A8K0CH32_IGNLU|nr:hypothetical protein ILUMI_18929 [Ignelater luminosus]